MSIPYGQKGVDGGSKWRAGTRKTEVRLDRWSEGGLGQQRNEGLGHHGRIRWCGTDGFQAQGQCLFIGLSCSILTIVFYYFSLSLLSVCKTVGWYFRAGIFGLIVCISLSPSLALPTFFHN